jgi:hypothetical protein
MQVFLSRDYRAAIGEWSVPIAGMLVTLMQHMLTGFAGFS